MRVNLASQKGFTSVITDEGGTVTGPLILFDAPTVPLEAATKGYVDNLSATKANSSHSHTLSHITDWPSGLNDTQLSYLSNVTSDVQLQLNNKLNVSGGSLSGFMVLHANPTNSLHPATKQYVDAAINLATGLSIADVIVKPYPNTPTGFLRCNGAFVSKATYPALYSAIGNSFDEGESQSVTLSYTSYAALGSGKPHVDQYNFNTATGIETITAHAGTLPNGKAASQLLVTKNRVYVIGGYGDSGASNTIYSAPINQDGTLGTWTIYGTLPINLTNSCLVSTKSKAYLIGGHNGTTTVNAVYSAVINTDGTLGSFVLEGGILPSTLNYTQAIVTKNRIYILGGSTGDLYTNTTNSVYYSFIASDGTLGPWTASGISLPSNLAYSRAVVTKNRVYLIGGYGNSASAVIYTAVINSDGTLGNFSVDSNTLPVTIYGSQTLVTNLHVYLLSGYNGSGFVQSVYRADINPDGTLGVFGVYSESLPVGLYAANIFATKSKLYIVGGNNGSYLNTVYTSNLTEGSGINDATKFYNGNINKFDGTNVSGTVIVYSANPDPSLYFGLPNHSAIDALTPGTYSYIKY